MNTKVSYGKLAPAMIGALGVVVTALLEKAKRKEFPVSLKLLPEVIDFSDSGIWGDDSLDPEIEPRVFRVSDFDGDFRLDYASAPSRAIAPDKLAKFRLSRGDILVVKSSGSANQVVSGRVAVFDLDSEQAYAASNFTLRLRPSADIDPHYLAFILGSPPVREVVADTVKTMTYPNLSFRIYSAIQVPMIPLADQKLVGKFFRAFLTKQPLPQLPVYLAEQRRVVARIEELAAQIHEARTLRHQAAEEAEALWERGASVLFDHATETYPIRPLADLVTIRGGGTPSKSDPFYWQGKIPWISPKDMKRRELSDAIDHISELATQESAAKLIEPGAVLVVVRGMILAHTFPSAVLRASATINQDMKALIPKKELLPEFLCALFWAANSRMLELVEKSTHDTRKFQTEKLLGTNIVVPPLAEQRRIVTELDALQAEVDALKRLQAETAAELDALLPAILDKAFKGEL